MNTKSFEGIKPSKALLELVEKAISVAQVGPREEPSATGPFESYDETTAVVSVAKCLLPMSQERARDVIKVWRSNIQGPILSNNSIKWVPVSVIRATDALLSPSDRTALEKIIRTSSLVYTPSTSQSTEDPEKMSFQKRMERLRLKNEEVNYARLTRNLKTEMGDDITTKSMTYAASIGLNMIIAPLSFGCFMYFFAGGLFDWFWQANTDMINPHVPDIKRIIVGVVSGVLMLFVEMLLFVIRTHEMDEAMRKKSKKKKPTGPFSHYTSKTIKVYQEQK